MSCELPIRAGVPAMQVELGFAAAIDEVATDARHLFLRRSWFAAAGGAEPVTLIGLRPDGRSFAALPTVAAGPRLLSLRAVPGCYWPYRLPPVAADATDGDLAALLGSPEARRALGRAWRLGPAMDSDPVVARLLRAAQRGGWSVLARRTATSHALDIAEARKAEPWPKPSTLRNLKKQEKKLARLGELGFRFVSGAAWSADVLDTLAAIERGAWVGSRADADPKFVDPALRRGWEAVIADPEMRQILSVGILSVGAEPAAFSFGMDCATTRYCIATSYDARFAEHGPGYVVGYRTYFAAVERGVERLSLGAGDNGEKSGMGATPEGELADYLFVRGRLLAAVLRPLWR